MADEDRHPVVVLEAGHHVAEVVSVGVPSRTGEPAEVRLFAHHGDPGDPGAEPVFGIDLVADGSCIYILFALGGRPGTWKLSHPVGRAPPDPRPASAADTHRARRRPAPVRSLRGERHRRFVRRSTAHPRLGSRTEHPA